MVQPNAFSGQFDEVNKDLDEGWLAYTGLLH